MNNSFEPWKLTAYILGELDENETKSIRSLIEGDVLLQKEVAELRCVLDEASLAFESQSLQTGLTESHHAAIDQCIASTAEGSVEQIEKIDAMTEKALHAERVGDADFTQTLRSNRDRWQSIARAAGLAGVAASFAAALYVLPQILKPKSNEVTMNVAPSPSSSVERNAKESGKNTLSAPETVSKGPEKDTPSVGEKQEMVDERMQVLVDQYNDLVDKGQYGEAEVVVKAIENTEPNSEIAPVMKKDLSLAKKIEEQELIAKQKNDSTTDAYVAVDEASAPFDDRVPYFIPDAREWDLKERKKRGAEANEDGVKVAEQQVEKLEEKMDAFGSALSQPLPDHGDVKRNAVPNKLGIHKPSRVIDSVEMEAVEQRASSSSLFRNPKPLSSEKRLDESKIRQLETLSAASGPVSSAMTEAFMTDINTGVVSDVPLSDYIQDPNSARFLLGGSVNSDLGKGVTEAEVLGRREASNRDLESRYRQLPVNPPDVDASGDKYEAVPETNFVSSKVEPLSTFSIDVDTASYSKLRQYINQASRLPSPQHVRIEELINYFDYSYAGPVDDKPFASHLAIANCPWNSNHQLVRIALQAKKVEAERRPKANLVFLLDVSGSMDEPNKLPLVKKSLSMLVRQLGENDRIAIVVYAGAAGCVLPSTLGSNQAQILSALDDLNAGGSTNGGQGIELAYRIAREHFIPNGTNRVILCTDGDFNVGVTSNEALVELVTEQAKSKVFMTCLGFGIGNYNDSMMEQISNKGNGIYGMIDTESEARRVMVQQLSGTLVTVAKDVKIQVEFNPAKVASYRLIGYENRRLAHQDFNDDKKDAGEIGAGHRVTALYEVVPVGVAANRGSVDELRYQKKSSEDNVGGAKDKESVKDENLKEQDKENKGNESNEWLAVKLRYKLPMEDTSSKLEFVLDPTAKDTDDADADFKWASAVAEFGLLLRRSQLAPDANWSQMIERARSAVHGDAIRDECVELMVKAKALMNR